MPGNRLEPPNSNYLSFQEPTNEYPIMRHSQETDRIDGYSDAEKNRVGCMMYIAKLGLTWLPDPFRSCRSSECEAPNVSCVCVSPVAIYGNQK